MTKVSAAAAAAAAAAHEASAYFTCAVQFLCNGLEDDLMMRLTTKNRGRPPSEREAFELASGKITLLAKLLPKLWSEGHKVLIFSQFKIMLDLVEYYLNVLGMPWERIDGDVNGARRCVWRPCMLSAHWSGTHLALVRLVKLQPCVAGTQSLRGRKVLTPMLVCFANPTGDLCLLRACHRAPWCSREPQHAYLHTLPRPQPECPRIVQARSGRRRWTASRRAAQTPLPSC